MDPLLTSLGQPHVHLTEVELGKLPGHALEADHQGLRKRLVNLLEQPIKGTLA